jgi:hypothetical protein
VVVVVLLLLVGGVFVAVDVARCIWLPWQGVQHVQVCQEYQGLL